MFWLSTLCEDMYIISSSSCKDFVLECQHFVTPICVLLTNSNIMIVEIIHE